MIFLNLLPKIKSNKSKIFKVGLQQTIKLYSKGNRKHHGKETYGVGKKYLQTISSRGLIAKAHEETV